MMRVFVTMEITTVVDNTKSVEDGVKFAQAAIRLNGQPILWLSKTAHELAKQDQLDTLSSK